MSPTSTATPDDFLDKDGKWQCTQCGACCKSAGLAPGFPKQWVNKRGGCKNQMSSNKCRIYTNRPPICRVDISLKDFTDRQKAEFCAQLLNFEKGKV